MRAIAYPRINIQILLKWIPTFLYFKYCIAMENTNGFGHMLSNLG